MTDVRIDKIVVVGRDAPLWLAANVLRTALKASGVSVQAVELPGYVRAHDVYATQPALEALHTSLGLTESAVLQATGGAFSLGQSFDGFSSGAPPFLHAPFFHAYGSYGAPIANLPFFPSWQKARGMGLNVSFEDFSLTAAAAKQGRVLIPDATTSAFARCDYGYHLPAVAYATFLKAEAIRNGVIPLAAQHVSPLSKSDGSGLEAVILDGGQRVSGDLFIDMTGTDALLVRAFDVKRDSWRAQFPGDRVLVTSGPRLSPIPAYARIRAQTNGWLGHYPSQSRTHLVQVFSGVRQSDDEALRQAALTSGLVLGDAVVNVSSPGRRVQAWTANCVAIGESACAFDPIDNVELLAVQTGLVHLLALFPVTSRFVSERDEYNNLMQQAFERMRDFQLVHYALNACGPSPFWDQARAAPLSAELGHKLAMFRARGLVPMLEQEGFAPDSWRAILLGHGLRPETYDPRIDTVPPEEIKRQFQSMLGFIKTQVEGQASHESYLELFGVADPARAF